MSSGPPRSRFVNFLCAYCGLSPCGALPDHRLSCCEVRTALSIQGRSVCFDCFDKIGVWFVIRHKYLEESLLISLRHCLFVLLDVSLFESCELDKAGGSESRVGSSLLRLILVFWVESWFCSFCFGL